jgi:hypothetical protein
MFKLIAVGSRHYSATLLDFKFLCLDILSNDYERLTGVPERRLNNLTRQRFNVTTQSSCETDFRHFIQPAFGAGTICARTNDARLQNERGCSVRNGLLRGKTIFRFPTRSRSSFSIKCPESEFICGSGFRGLDFTGKSRGFTFLRF